MVCHFGRNPDFHCTNFKAKIADSLASVSHNLNKSMKTRWRQAGESTQILLHKKFKQHPAAPMNSSGELFNSPLTTS
jgi:hypothetical protein